MFCHLNKTVKLALSTLIGISASSTFALAQSPYVQTYGPTSNQQRAKAAAKQIENSSKTTKGATTSTKKKVDMVVAPKQHVSAGPKWQQFSDYINLKPGQENLPLKFTILNGSGGTPPLKAIRATLSGRNFFSEKDFKGNRKLSIDLSNALTAGSTQIVFQAFGDAGSAFKWQISSSVSPEVTSLSSDKAASEATLTAKGKNLPTDKASYVVKVDSEIALVSEATQDNFKFSIPKKVKPGKNKKVEISISGTKMKAFTITVLGVPEITYMDHISIAGNQTLTIKGKNFSTKKEDIEVTFNGTKGRVTGATDESISVVTPDIENLPSPQTVQVKVNGQACKRSGVLLGSMRVIPNAEGAAYSPFEIPTQLR